MFYYAATVAENSLRYNLTKSSFDKCKFIDSILNCWIRAKFRSRKNGPRLSYPRHTLSLSIQKTAFRSMSRQTQSLILLFANRMLMFATPPVLLSSPLTTSIVYWLETKGFIIIVVQNCDSPGVQAMFGELNGQNLNWIGTIQILVLKFHARDQVFIQITSVMCGSCVSLSSEGDSAQLVIQVIHYSMLLVN